MQDLITGVPGAGKSQRAIWRALNDPRFKGRQVYYHNFGPLNKLDPRIESWIELDDFKQWHKLPPGSVLLVDECQSDGILPQRSATAAPPEHVEAFSKSRKLGIDVILVTQHAKNIDLFVRRLIEVHEHLDRVGQMNYATVTEYRNYQDTDSKVDPALVVKKTRWLYDKSIWTLYKSSEMHTTKVKVPRVVWWLVAAVLGVAILIPLAIYKVKSIGAKAPDTPASANAAPVKKGPGDKQDISLSRLSPQARAEFIMHDTRDYAYASTPLDPAHPESAPIYAKLREPKTFPRVVGAVVKDGECRAFNQQGIREFGVPQPACLEFINNGRFDPYRDERLETEQRHREMFNKPAQLAAAAPAAVGVTGPTPPPPVSVPESPSIQQQARYFDGAKPPPATLRGGFTGAN